MNPSNAAANRHLGGTFLSTTPPLVHFTTADINDLADGKRDVGALVQRLEQLGAVVLLTPEHLMEWLPVPPETRERRFLLADKLPHVAWADWPSQMIWAPQKEQFSATGVRSGDLRAYFCNADGTSQEWLVQRKREQVGMGGAEFFHRGAQLSDRAKGKGNGKGKAFDVRLLDKYHELNRKHGSDVSKLWSLGAKGAALAERVGREVGPLVPRSVREGLKQKAAKCKRFLDSLEPRLQASFHGVAAANVGFLLWWETRRKLWSKPDEVGGLSERVDLQELRLWTLCSLITLDKRVFNAVREAIRTLGWDAHGGIKDRFVRAGDERAILARLDELQAGKQAVRD